MSFSMLADYATRMIADADDLVACGRVRDAIELLTRVNRGKRDSRIERALVRIRRDGCRLLPPPTSPQCERVHADPAGRAELIEVPAAELSVASLTAGFAAGGCLLVRGLVPPKRAAMLGSGIDAALAAYDRSETGAVDVDPGWYTPFSVPDQISEGEIGGAVINAGTDTPRVRIPEARRRRFIRHDGGLWTANSPRMLFELFDVIDELELGTLMENFLGQRPFLSANKCLLRRVPPMEPGGWHQDGAFLGEDAGAFNVWLALSECGRDAPGLDIVAKRIEHIVDAGADAAFKWSLSDATVARTAEDMNASIVRPLFEPGDALIFDQFLIHRTAASTDMTRDRYAIESWFFAPGAYPQRHLPLVY